MAESQNSEKPIARWIQKLGFVLRPKSSKKRVKNSSPEISVPAHLAVIMDGNGRWAKKRRLPRSAGHRAGAENLKVLCRNCGRFGVRYLTVYAFSTENWTRPESEVKALMELFVEFFEKYDAELEKEGIRVRFSGDIEALPDHIREVCGVAEENSRNRDRMDLIIAMNYGGRHEIVQACRRIAQSAVEKRIDPTAITEDTIRRNLYLPDVPDPDLIIRPSGEQRLSNFLLWESAYSEMWFSNTLWPDFGLAELEEAFVAYAHRDRRFGGISEKK
ncbi:MAG: isoprenyl transferase [Clostridiales bacterium]|nr:isoprenyl transferase [Clostridiales bacterium]